MTELQRVDRKNDADQHAHSSPDTGKELWRAQLPAGARETPMTYVSGRDNRQYVAVAASGGDQFGQGDYVMAFTIPTDPDPGDSRRRWLKRIAIVALMLAAIGGCAKEQRNAATSSHSTNGDVNAAPAASGADTTVFPAGPEGAATRRGFAILAATRDSMSGYVGNQLRCFSCHIDNGHRANGIPLTGVYARYPSYSARDSRMITIQDRVNNCFRRSLAGRNIPLDGKEMHDIVAYLALVSRGVAVGTHVVGEGLPEMPALTGDPSRGETMFAGRCARCHGDHGQGIPPATPLWGPGSFSIGASLARVERAASFIRYNMPFDSAGVLTDQQAYDIAAYVVSQPRRESRDTGHDWANGGAPRDVPYNTKGHAAFNPPKHLLPSAF